MPRAIRFTAVIERLAPEVPRFVVYSGDAWGQTETFVIDVRINGQAIGWRSLVPWKERGWSFGLSEPMCKRLAVETGARVDVEMTHVADPRVPELRDLLEANEIAAKNFERLTPAQRRMFCLEVADAKSSTARNRRASRLLNR